MPTHFCSSSVFRQSGLQHVAFNETSNCLAVTKTKGMPFRESAVGFRYARPVVRQMLCVLGWGRKSKESLFGRTGSTSGAVEQKRCRAFARHLFVLHTIKNARRGSPPPRVRLWLSAESAHQLFDLRGFALGLVPRIRVSAMDALLTKSCAAPDQVVHGALQLFHSISGVGQRTGGRWISHARKGTPSAADVLSRGLALSGSTLAVVARLLRLPSLPAVTTFVVLAATFGLAVGALRGLGARPGGLLRDPRAGIVEIVRHKT